MRTKYIAIIEIYELLDSATYKDITQNWPKVVEKYNSTNLLQSAAGFSKCNSRQCII